MFQKLQLQMTLFCTLATGSIFLALTFLCLFFAEGSLKKNNDNSFLLHLNSVLIHLQEQDTISHQWLNQLQGNGQLKLYLYDNGTALFYQDFHSSQKETQLVQEAVQTARREYQTDIFSTGSHRIIIHTEFPFTSSAGQKYLASVGVIPKQNGQLNYILLSPLKELHDQIRNLRLAICLASLAAVFLLFLFSYHLTKRMVIPLEENHKRQTLFIASASHELRAPLAVLRSGLEALKKAESPSQQKHFIDMMAGESRRMQNLINNMLLLANADSKHLPLQMAPCQPDEMLLKVYETYEPLAARQKIILLIELPEAILPDLLCDRERMIQVFYILMDNALSYTPSGGKITLSLTEQKNSLLFSFSDSGCGIPDPEKTLIFSRFYRSGQPRDDKEHFGLGLCIAKEIVQAHKGSIWVEDHLPQGSRFLIRLPASAGFQ